MVKVKDYYCFCKRLLDVLVSILGLFFLFPILLIVALIIYLQDRNSVFFTQNRVGLNGRQFKLYKFRSMVLNAESIGSFSTSDNDARITPFGKFIRKTSIDELPQLINVLTGDMSIVGPRPDVPLQKQNYTELEWIIRHSVKPGVTGLAQATLRSSATPEQRKALDLQYVEQKNICLDVKIIGLTFKQVLCKGGN